MFLFTVMPALPSSRDSERVKASAQERQRIMQDMHDGLGSQLLSSLMLVERGALSNEQVAQILRESIDDMRLAIDALAQGNTDLLAALDSRGWKLGVATGKSDRGLGHCLATHGLSHLFGLKAAGATSLKSTADTQPVVFILIFGAAGRGRQV